MPGDITMCVNLDCPRRSTCYRAMAIACHHQYFSDYAYVKNFDDCDYFISIGDKPIRQDKKVLDKDLGPQT